MPVLRVAPALYLDYLFDEWPKLAGPGRLWWGLQTRPRQEKSLARQLFDSEIP